MNIFDLMYEPLKLNQPIKVGTLFFGIGTQEMALKRLGINHTVEFFCEIDKYAVSSYKAIHGENIVNLGDIKNVEMALEKYIKTLKIGEEE